MRGPLLFRLDVWRVHGRHVGPLTLQELLDGEMLQVEDQDTVESLLRRVPLATAQSVRDAGLSMWHVRRAIWPGDPRSERGPVSLAVNVERTEESMLALPGVKVDYVPVPALGTVRGLTLWVNDGPGRMHLQLMCPSDAYPEEIQQAFLDAIYESVLYAARHRRDAAPSPIASD